MKKRKCADCLYYFNQICNHAEVIACTNSRMHQHWRPRTANKLSPSLRKLIGGAQQCKHKTADGHCTLHSDDEVKEYCVEAPCPDEETP